jgi:hypothetical protein
MKLLIASILLLLLLVVPVVAEDKTPLPSSPDVAQKYVPLTREEANEWIASVPRDTLVDFVIKYDEVEHSGLLFSRFDYVCLVTGKTVTVVPVDSEVDVSLASLGFRVRLPTMNFPDVVPSQDHFWRDFGIGAGLGTALGVGITIVVVLIANGTIH